MSCKPRAANYLSARSAGIGLLASALLVAFYFSVMTIAQGADAAIKVLVGNWRMIVPLVIGFGAQIGLFARARELHAPGSTKPTMAVAAGASTGLSGLSTGAATTCSLAEPLPFLALPLLALFLDEYQQTLMAVGIVSNLAGVAFMALALKRCRHLS